MLSMNFVRCYILLLLWVCSLSWAQTLGGTVIPNQAVANYEFVGQAQPPESSNTVTSLVPSLCALSITPNGSVTTPAQQINIFSGSTVYLPYVLTNTGNAPQDFSLLAQLESASSITPLEINIILDSNTNQIADPTESVITDLTALASGDNASLLLEIILDADFSIVGDAYINLVGVCASDASIQDNDNISQVTVLEGGVRNLSKSSVPASGSFVVAGDTITYTVSFEVNQNQLSNVLISDVMDVNLETPLSVVLRVNDLIVSGVTNYDPSSRTITATLATLEPNEVVELTILTAVKAGVLGGLTLRNQATLDFDDAPTQTTNQVTHTTVSTCGLVITPDGTTTAPAHQQNALPGQTIIFPYTLTNIGNITSSYDLSAEGLTQSTVTPSSIKIFIDTNANGQRDVGDVEASSLTLAPDDSADLLVVVELPSTTEVTGDAFVNLIGVCQSDINARDDNNVSQATIPLGGFADPQKSSDPVSGTRLYPGVALKYFISFSANGRDLNNVVLSDVLSDLLEAPSSFTNGTVSDTVTGLSATAVGNYDVASRKLTWTLASVPAGMTVTLEIVTAARADLTNILANTVIENVASIKSQDTAETFTNTTVHPVSPIAILLRKIATPERVVVGETLHYTLTVINPDDSLDLQKLELTDTLPEVLRYQPNTSVLTLPDGTQEKIEPIVSGQKLTWTLPPLAAGEHLAVDFGTTVLPGALDVKEIVNTAQVVASDVNGRAVADAAASVGTVVQEGALTAKAVLLGTVFIDYNLDGIYDQDSDTPVENVRLYLSDGHSVLSDAWGRYTFLELDAGIESLKVDNTTLPARLLAPTSDEVKAGLWRVRLEAGLIIRQDVPLLPPGALLDVDQSLNVTRGPVKIKKSIVVNQAGSQVILEISSSQALKNVVITDQLPNTVQVTGEVTSDQTFPRSDLQFALGDIPAGYNATIRYPITFTGDPRDALIAPTMTWNVRP
jgi:fimbrial isopeptide formation D2 family protein